MKTYKSHKIVHAAKIVATEIAPLNWTVPLGRLVITLDDGTKKVLQPGVQRFAEAKFGDYFVVYDDGYESISPAKAFEEGYTEVVSVIPPEGAITHQFYEFKNLERILPALLMSASGKRADWFYLPPAGRSKSDPFGMSGYIGYKEIAPNAERIYAAIAEHTPALIQNQAKIDALASDIGAKRLAAAEERGANPLKDDSALYGGAAPGSGPKVTMQDITDSIASEHYFRAIDGVAGAALHIGDRNFSGSSQNPLNLLTFCVLELKNGYTVTGKSACVSAENFDADLGRKYAYEDAIDQCWPLLGFALI